MNRPGPWKDALIDIDRATEFVGDDVDRFSQVVDLGENFKDVLVMVPALNASAVVSVYAQEGAAIDAVPKIMHILDDDGTGSFAHSTSSGAGSLGIVFHVGGLQYLRIHCGADQAADRTFRVRGC